MASKLISLSLYEQEIDLLDKLVVQAKEKSFSPDKVNRSTVLRALIMQSAIDNGCAK